MKIVELFLDDNEESGIEAISIVESPAIESDFIALKSDEVKLAEVDKEKKILMGALLIPNKPIYRKTEGEEYYIYFSKETVLKASQRYLTNGYQGNSTLEHSDNLEGLTLVESWIVEDEVQDKSRKYGLNAPVGTWMGTIKVNNDEVWNDYVKTGKVKGFSIEGFFADKIEASKMNKQEQEADLLLSKITSIVKGEKVNLALSDDLKSFLNIANDAMKDTSRILNNSKQRGNNVEGVLNDLQALIKIDKTDVEEKLNLVKGLENYFKQVKGKIESAAKELGVDVKSIKGFSEAEDLAKKSIKITSDLETSSKAIDKIINKVKSSIK